MTQAYAVDDGDKLVSVREGGTVVKSYAYDAAGRTTGVTTSAGTTTLAYDYESRVTGIAYPGGATNAFSYNGLDARVGKADSGGTKTFRRDGAGVTDDVLSDGAAAYTPGVSQRRSGATTYELQDRMGSSVRQTDASRSSTGARAYDAYGVQIGTDRTPVGPFGFAGAHGYQGDGDSGLKLLGHRYYDPSTGRFLTRDPIKDGRNWYAYCGGNPLEGVDPSGLMLLAMYMSRYAEGAFPSPILPHEAPYNPVPPTNTGGGEDEPPAGGPHPYGPLEMAGPSEGDLYNAVKGPDWPSWGPPNGEWQPPLGMTTTGANSNNPQYLDRPCRVINALGDDVGPCKEFFPVGSAGYR